MANQSCDWDPVEKVYVKRLIKHIIMACGCLNEDTEEYVNECGTENCPMIAGLLKHVPVNGHPMHALEIDEVHALEKDEEEDQDKK